MSGTSLPAGEGGGIPPQELESSNPLGDSQGPTPSPEPTPLNTDVQRGGSLDQDLERLRDESELEKATNLTIDSGDPLVRELSDYLLPTAREPGSSDAFFATDKPLGIITPYITVKGVSWYKVIIDGKYDEDFEMAVDDILKERGSLRLFSKSRKARVNKLLHKLQSELLLEECIRSKMRECCSKPRGFFDYIRSDVSWDSNKKCLACPSQDCLIYIYQFYYNFLTYKIIKTLWSIL